MRKILLFIYLLFSMFCFGQSIKIVQLKNGGIFIESEANNQLGQGISFKSSNKSFYASPNGKKTLINGVQKAIEWAILNKQHQKEFEKEIARLRVMEKETFLFYKEFISQFSEECMLTFFGNEDGSFKVILDFSSSVTKITLVDLEALKNFKRILEGKSANSDIDNIFK